MSKIIVRSPTDQSVVAELESDTPDSVSDKVQRAHAAMAGWAQASPTDRVKALLGIADDTTAAIEELAELLSTEQGKTRKEARMELERYIGAFEQYAGLATDITGKRMQLGPGVVGYVERRPVGVVAGIVPWNFPASLFGTKLAPALAAGCGFVIKPAETTSLITLRLLEIAAAHLPVDLVQFALGGAEIGSSLVENPLVRKIAFTGSTAVGKQIAAQAAPHLKHLTLELGGSDPFIVFDDADIPQAVRCLVGTRFYNAGQVCVAPKRLIVHTDVYEDMVERLAERIERINPGPSLADGTTMGPLHTEQARARFEALVEDAVERGAEIVGGGRPATPETRDGWFVKPSLLLDVPKGARPRREEVFGPSLVVLRFQDDREALELAEESPYSLGASVWSADASRAIAFAKQIPAGYRWVNALARVYDELPFGGVGESGYGREHGREALGYFLEEESMVVGDN